jgi:hypothetical protein
MEIFLEVDFILVILSLTAWFLHFSIVNIGHLDIFHLLMLRKNGRNCNLCLDQLIVCLRMRIAQGAKAELVRSDWPFLQACIKEAIQECQTGIRIS